MLKGIITITIIILLYVGSLKLGVNLVSKDGYVNLEDLTYTLFAMVLFCFLIFYILEKAFEIRYKKYKGDLIDVIVAVVVGVDVLLMIAVLIGDIVIYTYADITHNFKIDNKIITRKVDNVLSNNQQCMISLDKNNTTILNTPCIKCNGKYTYVDRVYRKYVELFGYKIVLYNKDDKLVMCK